jgi:hypothetical protein
VMSSSLAVVLANGFPVLNIESFLAHDCVCVFQTVEDEFVRYTVAIVVRMVNTLVEVYGQRVFTCIS